MSPKLFAALRGIHPYLSTPVLPRGQSSGLQAQTFGGLWEAGGGECLSPQKRKRKGSEIRSETCPKVFKPPSFRLRKFHRHFSKTLSPPKISHKNNPPRGSAGVARLRVHANVGLMVDDLLTLWAQANGHAVKKVCFCLLCAFSNVPS